MPETPSPAKPDDQDSLEDYNRIADKVGLLPNIRGKDNLFQAVFVGVAVLLGALIGAFMGGQQGALLGVLAGLVGGGLLSGFALMIVGLARN